MTYRHLPMDHIADQLPPGDYQRRALDRSRSAKHGIGAAVERVTTDRSGERRWTCVITDGRDYHHIEAVVPGAGAHAAVPPALVERALEEEAGRHPERARISRLLNASPVRLPAALQG